MQACNCKPPQTPRKMTPEELFQHIRTCNGHQIIQQLTFWKERYPLHFEYVLMFFREASALPKHPPRPVCEKCNGTGLEDWVNPDKMSQIVHKTVVCSECAGTGFQ